MIPHAPLDHYVDLICKRGSSWFGSILIDDFFVQRVTARREQLLSAIVDVFNSFEVEKIHVKWIKFLLCFGIVWGSKELRKYAIYPYVICFY